MRDAPAATLASNPDAALAKAFVELVNLPSTKGPSADRPSGIGVFSNLDKLLDHRFFVVGNCGVPAGTTHGRHGSAFFSSFSPPDEKSKRTTQK